ncbi:MAG: stage 0 sporulation protein [Lentisphaerae bacterium]|nr:stage 0 sporulation protein [Lentisphaerota bacterium]
MKRVAYVEIEAQHMLRCNTPEALAIHQGDQCIVQDGALLEFGRVIELEETSLEAYALDKLPQVIRCATLQDQAKANENALMSKMAGETCQKAASDLKLELRLVRVRYSFDRAILLVNFTADNRVDFREMVKRVADELHVRVEMRQIGVRDEAGIIGGLGPCGRRLCCATWLHQFESINVKMAKTQGVSLNPPAISGMCGRLKCCLGYENDVYRDVDRDLPCENAEVEFLDGRGRGRVLSKNILAKRFRVRLDDERVCECHADEIREIVSNAHERRN